MSNLPADFSYAAAEPREHYFSCKANCDWADEYSKPPFAEGDECLAGHTDHTCNCDEIAAADPGDEGVIDL